MAKSKKTMVDKINKEVVGVLMRGRIPVRDSSEIQNAPGPRKLDLNELETKKSEYQPTYADDESQQQRQQQRIQPVRVEKKIGRNELCPCGSGKKYKHCHGRPGAGAQA